MVIDGLALTDRDLPGLLADLASKSIILNTKFINSNQSFIIFIENPSFSIQNQASTTNNPHYNVIYRNFSDRLFVAAAGICAAQPRRFLGSGELSRARLRDQADRGTDFAGSILREIRRAAGETHIDI